MFSQVLRASVIFVETQAGDLSMAARVSPLSSGGAASRRRERRLRNFWRHEQLSLKMMAASMSHHSWQSRESVGVQTDAVTTPVDEYIPPAAAPYAATASPIPVTEDVTPAPAVTYAAPAPMIEYVAHAKPETVNAYVAPAPVIEYIAPPPQVFYPSLPNEAVTGLVNPQFSITADETSQVQVVVQEIPQVPIVEWIQEQIVETIEVIPLKRVKQHTAKQIMHVLVHQIQEQSASPGW